MTNTIVPFDMKKLLIILSLLTVFACDVSKNKAVDALPDQIIYDDQKYSTVRKPIAITQTNDGGFIILCTRENPDSEFPGIYLMKTNAGGKFEKDTLLSNELVSPFENLIAHNGRVYFLAMQNLSLVAKIVNIAEDFSNIAELTVPETTYPLSLNWDAQSSSFLLQCYNRDDARTELFRLNVNGSIAQRRNLSVGAGEFDLEKTIIEHLTGLNKRLPFGMGRTNDGTFFFNGFFRYTFSLCFFGFNTQTPGVLQGFRDNRGVATVLQKSNGMFALSRFGQGSMAFIPNASVNTQSNAVASSGDLQGFFIPEIDNYTRIVSLATPSSNPSTLLFASANRKRQLCVYRYDYLNGNYLGTSYFGLSGSHEIGGMCNTKEGGVAFAATVYLAGRIPKVTLFRF